MRVKELNEKDQDENQQLKGRRGCIEKNEENFEKFSKASDLRIPKSQLEYGNFNENLIIITVQLLYDRDAMDENENTVETLKD